jgi:hypothetical protein
MRALSTGQLESGPQTLSLFTIYAFTIGPMSAEQHKQIGIRGGARSFQLRGDSIKQNESFEKSQELKSRSENFKK